MDVKVILEENKTEFENQIKKYIEMNYILKDSNFNIYNYHENYKIKLSENLNIKYTEKIKDPNKIVFYALMIKE